MRQGPSLNEVLQSGKAIRRTYAISADAYAQEQQLIAEINRRFADRNYANQWEALANLTVEREGRVLLIKPDGGLR